MIAVGFNRWDRCVCRYGSSLFDDSVLGRDKDIYTNKKCPKKQEFVVKR